MVDNRASIEQSIVDKIRSRGTLIVNEEDSLSAVRCVSAIQNSSLARWCLVQGEAIPIPRLSAEEERPFVRLVDEIHAAKDADPAADTSHLELEIDRLVYDLYGLTEAEDTAVERSLGLIHQTDEEEDLAIGQAMDEALAEDPDGFVSEEAIMATLQGVNGD